jgi:fibro-slime domain-containing protein
MGNRKRFLMAAATGLLALPTLGPAQADQLMLTGVVRDFKRGDQAGGHPDFQTAGAMGRFGHIKGLVTLTLGEDGKPVYNPTRPSKDTMQSAASFAQWYNDVPNVNTSAGLTLTLDNGDDLPGGTYTYSSDAFWPIDGLYQGNEGLNHNFHFTFELHTTFTYRPGHFFTFRGDDDVWVYVNGKRVIDLGGVHSVVTGSVLLFSGNAYVDKNHFTTGGIVKQVDAAHAANAATRWSRLQLTGTCPIVQGSKYIEMGISPVGAPEARSVFNGTSATVYATDTLQQVVLQFVDSSTQIFNNPGGYTGTFSGTGAYAGKVVAGCWVKAAGDNSEKGVYVAANGGEDHNANLDFFFAERHTTQSNFQIQTSMKLTSTSPATISPLYD